MFEKVLEKLNEIDQYDNNLVTSVGIAGDGSWTVERESDLKILAAGNDIESLLAWGESPLSDEDKNGLSARK